METNSEEQLKKAYQSTLLVYYAMVVFLIVAILIVQFADFTQFPWKDFKDVIVKAFFGDMPENVLKLFGGMMVFVVVSSLLLCELFKRNTLYKKTMRNGRPFPISQRLMTGWLIGLSGCNANVVFGFVLFLLSNQKLEFYGFVTLACIGLILNYPIFKKWEEIAQKFEEVK